MVQMEFEMFDGGLEPDFSMFSIQDNNNNMTPEGILMRQGQEQEPLSIGNIGIDPREQGKYIRKEKLTQALNCSCISELNTGHSLLI